MFYPVCVFAHTRMGYPICIYSYGMPIRVWDDIFTKALSYYKHLNLSHNRFIEVKTHRNCKILQSNKYLYRRLICRIVLMFAIQLSVYNSYMHLSFSQCRNVLSQMKIQGLGQCSGNQDCWQITCQIYSQLSETVMLRVVEQPPPT